MATPARFPTYAVELRPLLFALRLTGFLLLGAALLAWARPEARTWGIHHLAFLPPMFAGCLAGLGALLWTPVGGWLAHWLFSRLRWVSGRPAVLWAAVAAALFFALRVSVPLMGDGPLWIKELVWIGEFQARKERTPVDRWKIRKEPLELALHEMVFRTAILFRPPDILEASSSQSRAAFKKREQWFVTAARNTYAWLSVLAGALTVFMVVRFARRRIALQARTPFLLTLFSGGSLLLFFGYIEHYSLVSLATIAFLLAGLEESFVPRRFPLKTVVAFVLAVGCHLTAIILLPALLYLLYNFLRQSTNEPHRKSSAPRNRALCFFGIFVLLGLAGYVYVKGWKGWLSVLPLTPALSRDGYALFSFNHALDLLNLLALLALPAVVIISVLRIREKVEYSAQIQIGFLALAAVSGVAFVINFDPNLGMARDWDVLAVALWPLMVLAAWKLARSDLRASRADVLAALAGFVVLVSLPYVLVQSSQPASVARFESLLHMDESRSAYGWENVAAHYEATGDSENLIRAWRAAVEASNNPRYMLNLSVALRLAGRLDEAELYCVRATRQVPEYSYQLIHLARAHGSRGDLKKARQLLALASELNPTDTAAFKSLERLDQEIARRKLRTKRPRGSHTGVNSGPGTRDTPE
jgi:tetratricopeptide (TPR) repeat protein